MSLLGQMIAAGICRLEARRDGVLISRQTATAWLSVWKQAEDPVLVRVVGASYELRQQLTGAARVDVSQKVRQPTCRRGCAHRVGGGSG
jgi:hypothetical protein